MSKPRHSTSWRQQALIEVAPETVWELVGDPNRYPDWTGNVVEVTGLPQVVEGATFRQVSESPDGTRTLTFQIDEHEELRSIRLRCLDTNTYTRFTLTPARGGTFVDIETGTESPDLWDRALDVTKRKRFFRGLVNRMLDGLRDEATGSERPAEKRTDLLT
jgi:uncharacterized protein YndB with AHSA1/START domain